MIAPFLTIILFAVCPSGHGYILWTWKASILDVYREDYMQEDHSNVIL